MIKKIENYLKNKIRECIKEQQATEDAKEQTFEDYSLPEIDKGKLLAMSIQKTHKDLSAQIPVGFAMDSCCKTENLEPAYSIANPVENIIFTHFAKQGFIGFQACALLTQNWLINKACILPPKDAIRPNYTVNYNLEDGEIIDQKFLTEIKNISDDKTKYNISGIANIYAQKKRQFGQVLAYPIIKDVDYSLPFNLDAVSADSYKGMTVVDPVWYVAELDSEAIADPSSLNYFRPTYFRMPNGDKIHYSWCLFGVNGEVPDVLKPTYLWGGYPVPQLIYKRVYAAEETANEAPMLAKSKRLLVADVNVAAAVTNPRETQQKLETLINYRDNFGVALKRPNENISQIDTSLTDFDEVIMTQYQLVAAASGVPASKLIETQPKGFNSNGDYEDNQYKMLLTSIQEEDLAPLMEMHYMLLCKSKFGLNRIFSVKFDEIDTPTEKERAEINEIQARTDATLVQAGVLAPDEVRQKLISDENSGYSGIDEEYADMDLEDGGSSNEQSPFSMDIDNTEEPKRWITTKNDVKIPVGEGETNKEASEEFFEDKEQHEKDIKHSFEAQSDMMTLLAMDYPEFKETVSGINTLYKSKYKNKKNIKYSTTAFIYKAKNHGFNNYEFYDKMINEEIDRNS